MKTRGILAKVSQLQQMYSELCAIEKSHLCILLWRFRSLDEFATWCKSRKSKQNIYDEIWNPRWGKRARGRRRIFNRSNALLFCSLFTSHIYHSSIVALSQLLSSFSHTNMLLCCRWEWKIFLHILISHHKIMQEENLLYPLNKSLLSFTWFEYASKKSPSDFKARNRCELIENLWHVQCIVSSFSRPTRT